MTRKFLVLAALSGSFVLALGYNCLPNFPNFAAGFGDQLGGILGG